ncbi:MULTISPECIES: IclR family transcriptional regulator [Rhodobacterales]|mgnify:FL=1|uniref:IclR family transcriptional regulator n=1 Tax=Yoonia sediminilitoris TaxID=1286148 RepID=A0A2T6KAJ8_9RHOB|nr:IclR family transcriptional regulator [Yoonia sediminilitoris]PUB11863.1 IclR family transcriptional regulator [Yoonia sediminilitoris]RCW91940.1 IclR family transcriptional regulator [Yoonia sediminilitoris]
MKEYRVESVEKALSILEAFSKEQKSLTLTEIAAETGLYKSNVSRLAASLERYGYLKRDPNRRFRLGPALWRLGALYRRSFELGESVRPALRQLVRDTGETASFYVPDQDERLCLYRENSPDPVRHHLEEGARLTMQSGAAGHVLAAFVLGDSAAKARLEKDGSCISQGERNPHIAAVAAPVIDATGQFYGAVSVSGPQDRLDTYALARAQAAVVSTAQSLGQSLS